MSKTIVPIGELIIVKPIPVEQIKSEGGVDVLETNNDKGVVKAVSSYLKDIYKEGDVVIYPKDAGTSVFYKKENCLWLNAREHPQGDVWGIETE